MTTAALYDGIGINTHYFIAICVFSVIIMMISFGWVVINKYLCEKSCPVYFIMGGAIIILSIVIILATYRTTYRDAIFVLKDFEHLSLDSILENYEIYYVDYEQNLLYITPKECEYYEFDK